MDTEKKKQSLAGKVFAAICLVLLFLVLAGLVILRSYISKISFDSGGTLPQGGLNPSGVTNILLIGVDNDSAEGWEERGNADGLMILTVNENSRRVVMTSLMRDVRVQVPDAYRTKLTLVYHDGGAELLVRTVEENFDIQIDAWVMVNYLSVIQVVDAVGGLDMELTAEEVYYMDPKIQNLCRLTGSDYEENRVTQTQGGVVHLNGLQTAAWLRVRYAGNADFERTERARRVLTGLKDAALDSGPLGIKRLADVALPCISTNLSQKAVLSLVAQAPGYLRYDFVSERIPVDSSWWYTEESYGSFVDIDFETNRARLHEWIEG